MEVDGFVLVAGGYRFTEDNSVRVSIDVDNDCVILEFAGDSYPTSVRAVFPRVMELNFWTVSGGKWSPLMEGSDEEALDALNPPAPGKRYRTRTAGPYQGHEILDGPVRRFKLFAAHILLEFLYRGVTEWTEFDEPSDEAANAGGDSPT